MHEVFGLGREAQVGVSTDLASGIGTRPVSCPVSGGFGAGGLAYAESCGFRVPPLFILGTSADSRDLYFAPGDMKLPVTLTGPVRSSPAPSPSPPSTRWSASGW